MQQCSAVGGEGCSCGCRERLLPAYAAREVRGRGAGAGQAGKIFLTAREDMLIFLAAREDILVRQGRYS